MAISSGFLIQTARMSSQHSNARRRKQTMAFAVEAITAVRAAWRNCPKDLNTASYRLSNVSAESSSRHHFAATPIRVRLQFFFEPGTALNTLQKICPMASLHPARITG